MIRAFVLFAQPVADNWPLHLVVDWFAVFPALERSFPVALMAETGSIDCFYKIDYRMKTAETVSLEAAAVVSLWMNCSHLCHLMDAFVSVWFLFRQHLLHCWCHDCVSCDALNLSLI